MELIFLSMLTIKHVLKLLKNSSTQHYLNYKIWSNKYIKYGITFYFLVFSLPLVPFLNEYMML